MTRDYNAARHSHATLIIAHMWMVGALISTDVVSRILMLLFGGMMILWYWKQSNMEIERIDAELKHLERLLKR